MRSDLQSKVPHNGTAYFAPRLSVSPKKHSKNCLIEDMIMAMAIAI